MSGRAGELAARFRQTNEEVIALAQGCAAEGWRRMVPHEGRSVAYLIDHIAYAYRLETKVLQAVVTGQEQLRASDEPPPAFTRADLDANNAARWEANPYPDREETIGRLRAAGETTASVIAQLSAEALGRTVSYGPLPAMPIAQFIERIVIGHPGMHLPGIRQELVASSHADPVA